MKKAIQVLSLFVLVFALGGCSYKVVKTDESQPAQPGNQSVVQQNQSLATSSESGAKQQDTNSTSTKGELDLQIKCVDLAKTFFNEDKWGRAAEDLNSSNVNYTNYYNQKYNKCFILISEKFSDGSGTSYELYDVLGHKEYANGTFGKDGLKKPSNYCQFNTGDTDCKSSNDFFQFVDSYMKN
jgi:hypothetical protein